MNRLRDLTVFVVGFFAVWSLYVFFGWKLGWLPDQARPWFRTTYWIGAALIWIAWQRTPDPLTWLGLRPLNGRAVLSSAAAIAVLLAWNGLRVALVGVSSGRAGAFTLAIAIWNVGGVFVEELVFRGVIQTRLSEIVSSSTSPWASIAITALLFLAIHVPGWWLLNIPVNFVIALSVFLIGLICGWLRHWTGSLWPAVAAHWANNIGAQF